MNSLMNSKDRGGMSHPHPIPSLSFSLSTPPDLSPDDEFIPRGASTKSTTSPADIQEEKEVPDGASPAQIDSAGVPIDSSHSPKNGGLSLVAPPGMGRRPSSQVISDNDDSGEMDLGSSISVFLESKSDADNLVTVSESPPDSETRSLVDMTAKERGMDDPELVNVANQFISEVISKAKEEASHKSDNGPNNKIEHEENIDPKLTELARQFVEGVIERAGVEAVNRKSMVEGTEKLQLGLNVANNNVIYVKEKSTLLSSGNGLRDHRRGPWYARAVRFLSGIFGKMCPCRTPGEP